MRRIIQFIAIAIMLVLPQRKSKRFARRGAAKSFRRWTGME